MTAQTYSTDTARWQAVEQRDPKADGRFLYGVRSTGVYCRPACASRRPLRTNVAFFETAEQARRAGYRACLRCAPDGDPGAAEAQAVDTVCRLIDEAGGPLSLRALGAAAGYSPTHLQKLFKRATGLSPRQYAANVRAERLRADLRTAANVLDAGYAAGYGSSRGVYEHAREALGMPPGAYKRGGAGQTIRYAGFSTAFGPMLLAATAHGLCALRFGDTPALLAELAAEFPQAALQPDDAGALDAYVEAVRRLLDGRAATAGLPLDPQGTVFQQRVWAALRQIPCGQTRSYSQVAQALGQPAAVRAVAAACARNPLAVVTPCHRVVGADGRLAGYRWGIDRKRRLLEAERAETAPAAGSQGAPTASV